MCPPPSPVGHGVFCDLMHALEHLLQRPEVKRLRRVLRLKHLPSHTIGPQGGKSGKRKKKEWTGPKCQVSSVEEASASGSTSMAECDMVTSPLPKGVNLSQGGNICRGGGHGNDMLRKKST